MKTIKSFLLFSIIILISSCGPKVTTTNPAGTDLSNYKSFAYLPNTNAEVEGMSYNDENINRSIVEAVKTNLRQEGFEVDQNNPDLLVLLSTATDREVATTTDPVYATYPYTAGMTSVSPYYGTNYYSGYGGYNNVIGYDTDTYSYEEGTLVINLIDRQTKNTIWKGVASDAIYSQTSTSAIQDMVNDIFEEFPGN